MVLMLSVVYQNPKPDKGLRPVGLLPALGARPIAEITATERLAGQLFRFGASAWPRASCN